MAEFIFLIPNMIFYTSIGFLTALKNSENSVFMLEHLEDTASLCENATAELADVLIDATDEKNLMEDIVEKETIKN